jgi:hypothetical protein
MVRKLALLILSLVFFAAALGTAASLYMEAVATGDHDDLYAAIFVGGMLGFVGLILLILVFRKPQDPDPTASGAAIWAVGMTTLGDSDGGNGD